MRQACTFESHNFQNLGSLLVFDAGEKLAGCAQVAHGDGQFQRGRLILLGASPTRFHVASNTVGFVSESLVIFEHGVIPMFGRIQMTRLFEFGVSSVISIDEQGSSDGVDEVFLFFITRVFREGGIAFLV